jgi:hypothetical protein
MQSETKKILFNTNLVLNLKYSEIKMNQCYFSIHIWVDNIIRLKQLSSFKITLFVGLQCYMISSFKTFLPFIYLKIWQRFFGDVVDLTWYLNGPEKTSVAFWAHDSL